jgi:cobalt-zinc-cadmium efflux system outer membrane protein
MRPVSLKESLEAAVKHERVVAAQSIAQAAQAEIRIADRAPAPTLSGTLASIDLEHGVGPGPLFTGKPLDKGLALDWTWERGEKRSYRTNVSKAQALALVAESQEVIKQQQLIVIDLFYEALSAQERLGILNELAKRAEQLATIAAQRFGLGDLSAQDLARLEIEAERARVDLIHSQWLLDRAKQQLRLAIGTD